MLARPARGLRRPVLRRPAVRDGRDAAPGARSGPGTGSRRGAGSAAASTATRSSRTTPTTTGWRSTRTWPRCAPGSRRSTASSRRTARCTSTATGGPSTTSGCCSTRCSGRAASSTSSCGRTTTAGGTATAGRASTTRSCGTPAATRWLFDRDAIDRVPYMAPGLVGPEKAARGKLPTDVWWMTIVPPGSAERTGYPTQKPVRLLERIVAASSRPGDLVLDPYAGSGTTGVAAARLGRRWLLVDREPGRRRDRPRPARPRAGPVIRAITLDFGNTLVPVPDGALREVVGETARGHRHAARPVRRGRGQPRLGRGAGAPVPRGGPARPRGRPRPAPRPDPRPAAGHARRRPPTCAGTTRPPALLSDAAERDWAVDVYSRGVRRAPAAGARPRARCSPPSPPRYALAVLSNWPLATTIDRYVEAAGWSPYLRAVVVSQRVGTIKPHPAIFAAARDALGRARAAARSSTSATTGRRTSSARSGRAGGRRTSGTARATRRSPAASATTPSSPTWSWTTSATWRRRLERLG